MSSRLIKYCLLLSLTALVVPSTNVYAGDFFRHLNRKVFRPAFIKPMEETVKRSVAKMIQQGSDSSCVRPAEVSFSPQIHTFLRHEFPCPPLLTRQHECLLRVIMERNLQYTYAGEDWLTQLLEDHADDLTIGMAVSKLDTDGYLSVEYLSDPLPTNLVIYVRRVKESLLRFVAEATDPGLALMEGPVVKRVTALKLEEGMSFTLELLPSIESTLNDAISYLLALGYDFPGR